MKKSASAIAATAALLPGIALAATPQTFSDLANQIVKLLGSATTDLIVLAIVVYFWGVSSSLFKQGEKEYENLRKQLLWGVFVLFLAVSIWGVVQLLQSSVFGSNLNGSVGGGSSGSSYCNSLNCGLGSSE